MFLVIDFFFICLFLHTALNVLLNVLRDDSCLWHSAAPSEDEPPVAKAPVQRKTKEAAPKKAPAAKKAAAPRKKAAGIHTLEPNT